MNVSIKSIALGLVLTLAGTQLMAAPNVGGKSRELNKTAAGCNQTTAVIDLDVNNVRARMMNGGDMWWDRPNSTAAYEVPKGSKKHALFAGSIWIGGIDRSSQDLKVAAQTYRQSGNDYWSGPLDENNGFSVNFQTCSDWDRFWKINSTDVNKFKAIYEGMIDLDSIKNAIAANVNDVPEIVKEWPAKGNNFIKSSSNSPIPAPKRDMADYVDVDGLDGYDWQRGDYPAILGDQYIWWVFNDKGDVKTETNSEAIGLEIHSAAFAFSTNDCLNEATFYNYKIYNYSTSPLDSTYMATWSDADLGYAFDDFVGCDTARGLGILYNGDAYDEGATGYGFEIPMVGIDYFQGPKFFDTTINAFVKLKMSVFTYYNNNNDNRSGNPNFTVDFYRYMSGSWKNGDPYTTACNALDPGPATKFVFYGDPCKGGWSEVGCNNVAFDRRFIHSSGPFQLLPGAEPNNIIIGAVWVPNVGGGSSACFSKLQVCDDKAQDLFDNNFKLPFGPQAPYISVQPLDRKIVFDIDNLLVSNNYAEKYGFDLSDPRFREVSPKAVKNLSNDTLYQFEGYRVYQLKDATVALSDIRSKDGSVNTDKAQLVFQCDKKNGIKDLINFEVDPEVSSDYYVPKLMASGKDEGIVHSFMIDKDAFATGASKALVNYKTYYFVVVAYAQNNFKRFDPGNFGGTQDRVYIESRTDGRGQPISVIKVTPHPATDNIYVQNYADYGTGIQIKRLEGIGNGGIELELTEASELEALGPDNQSFFPVYKPLHGPVDLKVVNPDSIKAGTYEIWFKVDSAFAKPFQSQYNQGGTLNIPATQNLNDNIDVTRGALAEYTTWEIRNTTTGEVVSSERNIKELNEKYLRKFGQFDWGISASVVQKVRPGDDSVDVKNGYISSNVIFADVNNQWLTGVADEEKASWNNWIRAGEDFSVTSSEQFNNCNFDDNVGNRDKLNAFESVLGGTFAPYNLANNINSELCGFGLVYGSGNRTQNRLEETFSIDIVMTSDRSKWSRCAVIEMTDQQSSTSVAQGKAFKYNLRRHPSWTGQVDAEGKPIYSTVESGMSYFPGYAINVETGERLNIAFGEESFNKEDNGDDMIWNPTERNINFQTDDVKWGGKHVIYVQRTKYDGGAKFAEAINQTLSSGSDIATLRTAYLSTMWVGIPLLRRGFKLASIKDGIVPTDTRLQIRVTRPYTYYRPKEGQTLRNNGWPLYEFTTNDIAPAKLDDSRNTYSNNKKGILDRIQVVPNPYYAYSSYENSRVDSRVKIINLPEKATIKIYTIDGTLIRTLNKNEAKTSFIDWDIKNQKNIPVSSGMYLIHVELPGIGETVLKWFGAMRPIDLISF